MLDGVPLQQLAPPLESLQQVDKEHPHLGALVDVLVELQPLVRHREELTLDGSRLADLGATEVDDSEEIDLAVFYALQPFDSFGGNILGAAGFSLLEARSRRQGDLLVHRVNGDDNPRTDHGSQAVSGGLQGVFQ